MTWKVRPLNDRHDELRFAFCDRPLGPNQEPPLGSHLVTSRTFYTHHGIYVGNGRVIHYSGLARGVRRGPVEDASLESFANGRGIRVRRDGRFFSRREVVERARSRLGECHYKILKNNCEHFCAWARRDESRSLQIERLSAPRAVYRAIRAEYERIRGQYGAATGSLCLLWSLLTRAGHHSPLSLTAPAAGDRDVTS